MSEEFIGTIEEIRAIELYLSVKRKESIDFFKASTKHFSLESMLCNAERSLIDSDLFTRLAFHGLKMSSIPPIPTSRYFLWVPEVGDRGGFHALEHGGYCHLSLVGRAPFLEAGDRLLRTAELARCYIHDSIHAATFKTFRRDRRVVNKVYRERYGLNIRNADGVSYSSPNATALVPEGINLNLLMDAVAQIYAGRIIQLMIYKHGHDLSSLALAEICDPRKNPLVDGYEMPFNRDVMSPASKFIDYWGGEELLTLILRAMLSGDQSRLRVHFNTTMRAENAFEQIFKQEAFDRSVGH